MHKDILRIAVPAILSNIVVPLLGLIDLSIAGHIGGASVIGAVSVGAMMFSLTYWNFGFLRMGTSGMTAQAYGAGNGKAQSEMLFRAVALALTLGVAIIAVSVPLRELLLAAISPTDEVRAMAARYFSTVIWGAPAMLATMSITGWFIGMQNSTYPLIVSLIVNIVNIAASLLLVFAAGMGFDGIPAGTLTAQWAGAALSAVFAASLMRKHGLKRPAKISDAFKGLKKFFRVNADIFMRSLCMMAVMLFFTAAGARGGDLTLAVNALFMQMYLFYSNFMDGFAYAGEALVGRFTGAKDEASLKRCVSGLFVWGWTMTLAFALGYGLLNETAMRLFSDDANVVAFASDYKIWVALAPIAGMAAFVWDGVFVGLTATRAMLGSLATATAIFFGVYFLAPLADGNNKLWLAYSVFLATRGLVLWGLFKKREQAK